MLSLGVLKARVAPVILASLLSIMLGSLTLLANHLGAPEVLTCEIQTDSDSEPGGEILFVDFTDVTTIQDGDPLPAEQVVTKYSLDLYLDFDLAEIPADAVSAETVFGDPVDLSDPTDVEVSFGTGDREDGRAATDSDLDISAEDLVLLVTTASGDIVEIEPIAVTVKVKALNSGQGGQNKQHSQNNQFSELFDCTL